MELATCDNEFASVRACASQQTSGHGEALSKFNSSSEDSFMGILFMSIGPLVRLLAAIGAVSSVAMIALLNLHY